MIQEALVPERAGGAGDSDGGSAEASDDTGSVDSDGFGVDSFSHGELASTYLCWCRAW